MKKNVNFEDFNDDFQAILMNLRTFALSKDLRQVAIEPRPQMINGHESQKDIYNIYVNIKN